MQALNACTAAFVRLESLVHQAEVPRRPRTIEEEDRMAMEDLILEHDGPDALEHYQWLWACIGYPEMIG